MTLTTQKIHHALKKAGHGKAVWVASGNIRGWGRWHEGYKIEKDGNRLGVCHITDHWASRKMGQDAYLKYVHERLTAYQKALEVAGIQSVLNDSDIPHLELYG